MANGGLPALTTDDLELICLSLAGDGRVLWGNAAGRALGRAQHPAALFLTDLVHPDDETIARDLLATAARQGRAGRIVRFKGTDSGARYLHLRLFRRQDRPSPEEPSVPEARATLVVQGWDVTDLVLRQADPRLAKADDRAA